MTDATRSPEADPEATSTATLLPPAAAVPSPPLPSSAQADQADAGPGAATPPVPAAPPAPVDGDATVAGAPTPPPPPPSLLDRLPLWTVPALLVGVPLLFWLVAQAVPTFYDNIIWKYYWGPIKADAENVARLTHDGVVAHSGYNVVNTLTWAVLLGVCILGIAQMLRRYETPMDARLIVAATSWVVVGSVAHVLEDTGLFETPLQYLFITPPIYLLFGAFGVGAFLIAQQLRRVEAHSGLHAALRMLWLLHVVLVLVWTGLWLKPWDQVTHYVNPIWVALFAVVSFFAVRHFILRKGTIDATQLCLTLSIGTYLLVGAYVASFLRDPWMEPSDNAIPWSPVVALALAGLVTALVRVAPRKALLGILLVGGSAAAGVVAVVVLRVLGSRLGFDAFAGLTGLNAVLVVAIVGIAVGARWWSRLKPQLPQTLSAMAVAYALPINLLIVFGQMVDAFATSLGIDLAGYQEKHVLSAAIIDQFRDFSVGIGWEFGARYPTFLAFASVKLLVSVLVIYAIDVYSKDDAQTHPTMIGLVKFAIIMVGLGPGVRDFVRLALGV